MNFFLAQEVMTDADTHLRETKDVFEKTKLYFMFDNPQVKKRKYPVPHKHNQILKNSVDINKKNLLDNNRAQFVSKQKKRAKSF